MSPPPPPPRLSIARRYPSLRTVDDGATGYAETRTGRKDASTNFPSVTSRERRTRDDDGGGVSKVPTTSRSSATSKKKGASFERDKEVGEAPRSGSAGELQKGSMGLEESGDRSAGDRLAAATRAVKTTRK